MMMTDGAAGQPAGGHHAGGCLLPGTGPPLPERRHEAGLLAGEPRQGPRELHEHEQVIIITVIMIIIIFIVIIIIPHEQEEEEEGQGHP